MYSIGIFGVVAILSTLFGVDKSISWWGNFERMDGVFTLLHFILYFLLVSSVLRTRSELFRYALAFSGVCIVALLAGVVQRFTPAGEYFLTLGGSRRVYGTLGNFIYFGYLSLFSFWLLAWIRVGTTSKYLHVYTYLGMALSVWGLFLARSRGPLLAFLVSLVVCALIWGLLSKNKKVRYSVLIVGFLSTLLILSAIFSSPQSFVRKIPGIGGLHEISNQSGRVSTRLMAWDIAWQGFLDRPILGWGYGNYYVIFNKFYNPNFLVFGWDETWFDHAHNQYFDVLSGTGLLGIVSYLGIFGSVFFVLYQLYRDKKIGMLEVGILTALVVAHMVNNLFVFEHPTSHLTLFFLFALIAVLHNLHHKKIVALPGWVLAKPVLMSTGLLFVWFLWYGNLLPASMNQNERDVQILFRSDPSQAISMIKSLAQKPHPHQRDVRNDFALMITELQSPAAGSSVVEEYKKIIQVGIDLGEQNQKEYPLDVRRTLVLLQLYRELLLVGSDVNSRMEELFQYVTELSPKRQQSYFYWSELALIRGDYKRSIDLVQQTIDDAPSLYHGYWQRAKIEGSQGKWLEARKYLELAKEKGFVPDQGQQALVGAILNNSSGL